MAGETILVVDDEKAVRDTFAVAFDEYKIVTVASAQEALDILSRPNDIDLLVLDVMMPGLTGMELLRALKRINLNYAVVVMTGYGTKEVVIEALRSGADEFIEKPFNVDEVKKAFEALLSRKKWSDEEGMDSTTDKIKHAQRFIRRNYNKTLTLRDVAKEIYFSPKYFSRIFKEKTHENFNKYRIGLRIKTAKQLLKKSSYTTSQIAYKVGYENPESFMKMFKKFTGFTPSQYRIMAAQKTKMKNIPLKGR